MCVGLDHRWRLGLLLLLYLLEALSQVALVLRVAELQNVFAKKILFKPKKRNSHMNA